MGGHHVLPSSWVRSLVAGTSFHMVQYSKPSTCAIVSAAWRFMIWCEQKVQTAIHSFRKYPEAELAAAVGTDIWIWFRSSMTTCSAQTPRLLKHASTFVWQSLSGNTTDNISISGNVFILIASYSCDADCQSMLLEKIILLVWEGWGYACDPSAMTQDWSFWTLTWFKLHGKDEMIECTLHTLLLLCTSTLWTSTYQRVFGLLSWWSDVFCKD